RLHDVDFVFFVIASKETCGKRFQYYAAATHCAIDSVTYRPVAGYVYVCPYWLYGNRMELSKWVEVIKHEITHAFVFSRSLFRYFPGAGHYEKEGDLYVIPNVVDRITRLDWETSRGAMEHDVFVVVTPKVREEARRHFNCSTLEGAELENHGGIGSAGSHWEKRLFEIMCEVDAEADARMLVKRVGVMRKRV
ncbi:hypothetical protein TELCIR_09154, partial [Teladorsagia circumcincta]